VWRTENTNLAILELLHVGIGWSVKITTQENVMLSPTEWVNALMLCAFHEPSGISECPWFPKAINTSSSTQGSLLIGHLIRYYHKWKAKWAEAHLDEMKMSHMLG
jgi:hypothetical protein